MARSSRCSSGCHARYRKRHGARPAGIRKLATSSPPAHPYRRARPSDTGTLPSTPRLDHQRQRRSRTTSETFSMRWPTNRGRIGRPGGRSWMAARAGVGEVERADREGLPPFAVRPVTAVAGAVVAVLVAVSWRYGYHRDELYYLQQSAHLAWGSVDSGPLVIAIARLADACCDGALPALRFLSALAAGGIVVLTALMARELGGSHLLSTTPFDVLAWAGILLLVLRILRTGNTRLWLPVGLLVGAALLNKNTVFFLLFGLGVGLLAAPSRALLWSPWVLVDAAVAAVMWAPTLAWQADHGWAMFEMSGNLREEHSGLGVGIALFTLQFLVMNVVTAPVWLSGLVRLWRDPERGPYRAVAIAFVVLAVTLAIAIGDRPYFLAPLYTVLFAAGAVAFEGRIAEGRPRVSRRAAVAVLVIEI